MKQWFKEFFCSHKWEQTSKMKFCRTFTFLDSEDIGYMRWWKCTKCTKTRRTQDWNDTVY